MDPSYENVRRLLDTLISFRKQVPRQISDLYARNNIQTVKRLKEVNIKLHIDEMDYNIPDNFFETINLKQSYQLDEKLCDNIYEQIQSLSILIKKRNCPVSKIVDDI